MAGAGEPPGRSRRRPVHHGRDRRARDSDVHQQRHPGRASDASSAGRKIRAGRRARVARRRPSAGSGLAHCRDCARGCIRARGSTLPVAAVANWTGRLWSGCCTSPMAGSSSTSYCVAWRRSAWSAQLFAIHALTVGAIGGMTMGMMTRTARGHTGRPLSADRFEVACFTLIALAACDPRLRRHVAAGRLSCDGGRLRRVLVRRVRALCDSLLAGVVAGAPRREARIGRGARRSPRKAVMLPRGPRRIWSLPCRRYSQEPEVLQLRRRFAPAACVPA